MLILGCLIIILFISIVLIRRIIKKDYYDIAIVFVIIAILSGFFLLIGTIEAVTNNMYQEEKLACLQTERAAIIAQIENGTYLGQNVADFNTKILLGRRKNASLWFDIFYGDYIDKVEPITVEEILKE